MNAVAMERPPKWDSWLPEGERLPDDAWEAHPDSDWTADHPFIGGRRMPYTYCERHMYGRWLEDGQVLNWRVVVEEPRR